MPKDVRKRAGILNGGPVTVQVTGDGVLLVPVAALPVEIYTKERLAEFSAEEKKLERFKLP